MLQFALTFIKNIKSGKHTKLDGDPKCNQHIHASTTDSRASLDGLSFCLMSIALLGESGLVWLS